MNLNEKWFYMKNRETHGPFALSEIRDLIQHGEIRAMDNVFHDSLGQWTPAGKAAVLQDFFCAAPVAVPPSAAASTPRRPVFQSPASPEPFTTLNGSSAEVCNIPAPPPPMKAGLGTALPGAVPGASAAPSGTAPYRQDSNLPKSATTSMNSSMTPQVSIFVPSAGPENAALNPKPNNTEAQQEQGELFDVDQEDNSGAVFSGISTPVSAPGDSDIYSGLFDCLPAVFRSSFPAQFGNQIVRFFYDIGNYALLSGILLLIIQIVLETIQTRSFSFDRSGSFGCILSLYAALRYVNGKLRAPIIRLNNLGEGYISSFAIPDALSVLFFIFGACGLAFFFSLGMAKWLPVSIAVIIGFGLFIAFAFAAVIAANPAGLKMSVNRNLSLSEDSVGTLQYFMKLGIRLCCGLYGIACMSCCVLIVYSQCNMFLHDQPVGLLFWYIVCLRYSIELLCFAAIPLTSFLFFLFLGCFIDFVQKVIQTQTGRRG